MEKAERNEPHQTYCTMVQGKTQKEEANPLKAHPEDDPPDRPVPGPPPRHHVWRTVPILASLPFG